MFISKIYLNILPRPSLLPQIASGPSPGHFLYSRLYAEKGRNLGSLQVESSMLVRFLL